MRLAFRKDSCIVFHEAYEFFVYFGTSRTMLAKDRAGVIVQADQSYPGKNASYVHVEISSNIVQKQARFYTGL